jgi:TonB family protein
MPSVAGTLIVGFLLWVSGGEKAPPSTPPPSAPVVAAAQQGAEPAALPIPWCIEPVFRSPSAVAPGGHQLSAPTVRLQWAHDGRVYGAVVLSTSGDMALDAAALQAVSEARICDTQAGQGTYAVQYVVGAPPDPVTSTDDNAAPSRLAAPAPIPTADFPFLATLQDPDGIVVLQSTPSMFGKNVSEMSVDTVVLASTREGKWIAVRTALGETGYVRQRQLRFDEQ